MKKASVLLLIIWLGVCTRCTTRQPVAEYPPIDRLLIDETSFPTGWVAGPPDTNFPPLAPWTSGRKEVEYVYRSFYDPSGSGAGGMVIQRFRRTKDAAREYEHKVIVIFRDTEWNTPWIAPSGFTFWSVAADQYQYACSLEGVAELARPECAYVAQYGVYVLEFHIDLYDTCVITYTDLLPIFRAIDERMTLVLDSKR